MDTDDLLTNMTVSTPFNSSVTYAPTMPHWYTNDYGTNLPIYVITVYHLYPVLVTGRILHILWYLIGLIGNSISLKIWTLSRMRKLNSSALYLVSINVCDVAYHLFHVFYYIKYFWGLPSLGAPGICQIWNVLNVIPQYSSQLLVLGFTIERFISIVKPFRGERFSKTQRAPKEITAIFVCVILISLPQSVFWTVDPGSGFCNIVIDVRDVYNVWTIVTESIIFWVVPLTTLILNIFVLQKASISLRRHRQLSANMSCTSRVNRHGKLNKPATKTLLCISFFRILTQLPVSLTYTFQNFNMFSFGKMMPLSEMTNDPQKIVFLRYWGARILIEIFGASHHALGVFIFYASTKRFRSEVKRICSNVKKILLNKSMGDSIEQAATEIRLTSSGNRIHINNKTLVDPNEYQSSV